MSGEIVMYLHQCLELKMEKSKGQARKPNGQWAKGSIPWNKGLKGYCIKGGGNGFRYKKGHIPWHTKEIYSERLDKDGYVLIKLDDRNKWKRKHIWIWEKEHGKVPEGHIIIFRDNNKYNFDINNLKCISRSVNAILCREGGYKYKNEQKDVMIAIAELKIARRKREKELKNARKRK